MSGAIRHVHKGDTVQQHFRADTWNAFIDAAVAHKQRLDSDKRTIVPGVENPANTILVQNKTGGDLDMLSIVSIHKPIILPSDNAKEFKFRVGFVSGKPGQVPVESAEWEDGATMEWEDSTDATWETGSSAETIHGAFAVLAEPIDNGKMGRAFIDGVVPVQINITHEEFDRADYTEGVTDKLKTNPAGSAQILWKQSGIGTKWATIRMSMHDDVAEVGKTDAIIAPDSTGTVSIWREGLDTGYDVTAKLDWMHGDQQVSNGKEVLVKWFHGERVWRIIGAECE